MRIINKLGIPQFVNLKLGQFSFLSTRPSGILVNRAFATIEQKWFIYVEFTWGSSHFQYASTAIYTDAGSARMVNMMILPSNPEFGPLNGGQAFNRYFRGGVMWQKQVPGYGPLPCPIDGP